MRLHEVKEVCNAMKRLNAGELGPDDLVKLRKRGGGAGNMEERKKCVDMFKGRCDLEEKYVDPLFQLDLELCGCMSQTSSGTVPIGRSSRVLFSLS